MESHSAQLIAAISALSAAIVWLAVRYINRSDAKLDDCEKRNAELTKQLIRDNKK